MTEEIVGKTSRFCRIFSDNLLRPPAAPSRDFLSPEDEARAFRRMRRRILATLLRQMFAQSRFRVSLVVVLTSLLWGGMFWMFGDGFFIPAVGHRLSRNLRAWPSAACSAPSSSR